MELRSDESPSDERLKEAIEELLSGCDERDHGWMGDALRIHIATSNVLSDDALGTDAIMIPAFDLDLDSYKRIAEMIHESYNKDRKSEDPSYVPEYPSWKDLPDTLKISNMCQALHCGDRVHLIGCHLDADNPSIVEISENEIEKMSVLEHERWVLERRSNGWRYGRIKNVTEKRSPYLVPWGDLPEEIREYDREAVRNMIPILKSLGIGISVIETHSQDAHKP